MNKLLVALVASAFVVTSVIAGTEAKVEAPEAPEAE
jgi:hypothetical protein